MSWHCSRALVEAFSAATCLDGAPSAPSNTTPTPVAFYWPDKTTEHSRLSRFGMTSEPLTEDRGAALLTWFREVFLAKTSVPPERGTAWTASAVGSGRKWLGLLARYDPDSRSWRTPQCSLVEGLDEFSETWPRWGSMRNGECWERQTWEPRTSGTESGSLLPTPLTIAVSTEKAEQTYRRDIERVGSPTWQAVLAVAERKWPTPVATMAKGSSPASLKRKSGRDRTNDRLDHAVMAADGGQLNPEWVEWLMGWPIGLTDLRPLATARLAEWQQQHGAF